MNEFRAPKDSVGRFAVVKLWPNVKAAEDECIARLKIAATRLGLDCIEVFEDGVVIGDPSQTVGYDNVDFVLHLHFDTPKRYDAFSIVALWNPVHFYHKFGYDRTSRNLTSHDDFISCGSLAADHHVCRMIRSHQTHLPPHFHLFHSTPDIVHLPSLGDEKLFYAGINWDRLGGGKSRHQELLQELDGTGLLRIFGPKLFQNVNVWKGYNSYVGELPFDGLSLIDAVSKAGVSLVLSSQPHKDAELMSSRLFESVAAGALIICDENPFAKKNFGDTLLYVDTTSSTSELVASIRAHLDWAHANPSAALDKISRAQNIFREHFSLTKGLQAIYEGLPERKKELSLLQNPASASQPHIRLHLLMPEYAEEVLQSHLASVKAQQYKNFTPVLVVDAQDFKEHAAELKAAFADCFPSIEIKPAEFSFPLANRAERPLGRIILELLEATSAAGSDAFVVVAPNEKMFSNHLAVLAGALQRDSSVSCAATAVLLADGQKPVREVSEVINFNEVSRTYPIGYGRFIFLMRDVPSDLQIALPYLSSRPLATLMEHSYVQLLPATLVINVGELFLPKAWDETAETAIIAEYCPAALNVVRNLSVAHHASADAQPAVPEKRPGPLIRLVKRLRKSARKRVNRIFNNR